ncbi:MAG: hypothetical protein K0U19_01775 [Proteobacteria bacterium]|nr:hypothetical protein [Pseudomonadota bacterium]
MRWFFAALTTYWHWWNKKYISVKVATAYLLLLSGLFFLLGKQHPQSDYRKLENQVEETKAEMRLFASEIARRNGLVNNIRAREKLNEKTIELLEEQIKKLETKNVQWQEKTTIYQHLLENKTSENVEIIIHALEINPDFARQGWELSAILVRQGKRKTFKGSYYFEFVTTDTDGNHTVNRLPESGNKKFDMTFYYEIKELIDLPQDINIDNIRIVILNQKEKQVTAAELGYNRNNDDIQNGNGNGYDNGNGNGNNFEKTPPDLQL